MYEVNEKTICQLYTEKRIELKVTQFIFLYNNLSF